MPAPLEEGGEVASLSGLLSWAEMHGEGSGRCFAYRKDASLTLIFWWKKEGSALVPQQEGDILTCPSYTDLKGLLSFATLSHTSGYREVLLAA